MFVGRGKQRERRVVMGEDVTIRIGHTHIRVPIAGIRSGAGTPTIAARIAGHPILLRVLAVVLWAWTILSTWLSETSEPKILPISPLPSDSRSCWQSGRQSGRSWRVSFPATPIFRAQRQHRAYWCSMALTGYGCVRVSAMR